MKGIFNKTGLTAGMVFLAFQLSAQSESTSGSNILLYVLIGIAIILFFGMLINVADNLIGIEAKQNNIDVEASGLTLVPNFRHLFGSRTAAYTAGTPVTVLTKGHDILLEGEAQDKVVPATGVTRYAVQPPNFLGLQPIPKLTVAVGDSVKAGDQLFFDKQMPDVAFVSPVSGEVIEINRGAKRAITEIVILADKTQEYRQVKAPDLAKADQATLLRFMQESGAWSLLHQRPFNIVPDPTRVPRDIFVSTFDTAPLAPKASVVIAGREAAFQKGIDVLAKLTSGQVHLGLDGRGDEAPPAAFTQATNASKRYFKGKHPAGNVGVQIHHTAPVGGSDIVWTLGVQEVITLGNLFLEGRFDASRIVALTGAELKDAHYVHTFAGANIGELIGNNLSNDHVRLISGDVLSGIQKTTNSYLNWSDDQITVIEEGDFYELFGWLLPIDLRPTISNTFPNFLFGDIKFRANTNTHGEKRAFVVTNDYEQVMPMDIYPQHLMKAIIINDIERMEGLGIMELVEEDVALCEFVCVSKQPLQQILREGLNNLREQV
ncbi:MAG: NADH:ubiquinone reductase (Na(+)-transporting) subunit A [Bacteroidetes bacterium]|nr:MAG: NADH:ubiquinone reductase (Na(+)-transporting) subunit A [Bacteroidota bacterium]PTM13400.1 MAG: NADH:ubiquinone reductase (Na(+)-transporting) subunit A [Bacteroidota bacterium]